MPSYVKLPLLLFLLPMLALAQSAQAETFPEKPPGTSFIVDKADLIKASDYNEINAIAGALLSEEKVPMFIVTISSLSSYGASGTGIEGYAQKLFDHWGIGYEDRNYGMLLLVSVGDRKARIEFGKDWAHKYDSEAADIMQNLIIPAFKRDDYSTGITDGVRGLNALARGLQLPKPTAPAWFWPAVIIGGIALVAIIINLFRSGRSGWAWALIVAIGMLLFFLLRNANTGSGGGFGGGSSGGGGATGSW